MAMLAAANNKCASNGPPTTHHIVHDAIIVHPKRHHDHRGFFQELYRATTYPENSTMKFDQARRCSLKTLNKSTLIHVPMLDTGEFLDLKSECFPRDSYIALP